MISRFEAVNTRINSLEKRFLVIKEITNIKAKLMGLEKKVSIR
ncbi:MAG: hypothetical protein QW272_07705 [Candidatus Methanomethylicaceae archaeon]